MRLRLENGDEHWIPFSQISDYEDYSEGDVNCTISITRWIAGEKGIDCGD
jgi:hypothetical protein